MKFLSTDNFYNAYDGMLIDKNGRFSVCKKCITELYDYFYQQYGTMEKAIHRMCQALNIMFSNQALDAAKSHIQTLLDGGKNVNAIFSIYLMKLTATKKSMNKSEISDFQYDDIGTIFTEKQVDIKEIPIPSDVIKFWGQGKSRGDIEYLETEYANFKNTHSADTYAEIVLLKEVCETMLHIKKLREANDPDTGDALKELRDLMKSLNISPNAVKSNTQPGADTFGKWIEDIEKEEPAQWLKSDPRGDMYRDIGNTDDYFNKYMVRPLRNFIQGSKDFNIEESEIEENEFDPSEFDNFAHIDDGEASDE
jgi:hypothetical protein